MELWVVSFLAVLVIVGLLAWNQGWFTSLKDWFKSEVWK